ncbi:MAG: Xaa-Pro peptidase family protein [Planctomycetota bacterium]
MAYWTAAERDLRLEKVRAILRNKDLDLALVYYDELNIANGWYLSGWCPQFEKGTVLLPREGQPMILGGPESEPFARQASAITETRNLPVFMVPDEEYPNATIVDFPKIFEEVSSGGEIKRVGMVGMMEMPWAIYKGICEGLKDVELLDITEDYQVLRRVKDEWERQQIRQAYKLADAAYEAMAGKIAPGVAEIEVAAAGEYAARSRGANGFGFTAIVGSGERADAVVPTASDRKMLDGETVMIGLAPKWNGYVGVFGNTLPVGGERTAEQAEGAKRLSEAFCLTKEMLVPGKTGREIDVPARKLYEEIAWVKYIVCPFAHSTGLSEVETPFFGPNADDPLEPGMTVCVDVSFFGHPDLHGARIETGYEITNNGPVPLSPMMDKLLTSV